ncbi:MAG: hypothetical protein AAB900_00515, partial [Patescibacteria group bacterium]
MPAKIRAWFSPFTIIERWVLGLLVLSFFVGLNFGFPLTTVTNDEMFFVGSVFRSLASHSFLPQGLDVPYGTLNYLLSFALINAGLLGLLPFFHFNLAALQTWVAGHYYLFYLAPRLVSVLALTGLLLLFYQLAREKIKFVALRLALISLLFTNVIITAIFHTGKVWGLSTFFLVGSALFLYRVWQGDRRYAVWTILFSFLAVANFPLAGLALISLPCLYFIYRQQGWPFRELYRFSAGGLGLLILILAINYQGIGEQIRSIVFDYTLSPFARAYNTPILESILLFGAKALLLFTPLWLALVASTAKIADRKLFKLALGYLVLYLLAVAVTARWVHDLSAAFRYLVPVGFFLTLLIFSLDWRELNRSRQFFIGALVIINLIYFGWTLTLLLRPTTFNLVRDWTVANLNSPQTAIINLTGFWYEPPLNQITALAIQDQFCASRCQVARRGEGSVGFQSLVLGNQTRATSTVGRKV